jgi:hypothetical protein
MSAVMLRRIVRVALPRRIRSINTQTRQVRSTTLLAALHAR